MGLEWSEDDTAVDGAETHLEPLWAATWAAKSSVDTEIHVDIRKDSVLPDKVEEDSNGNDPITIGFRGSRFQALVPSGESR